jgi:hypothetical protein
VPGSLAETNEFENALANRISSRRRCSRAGAVTFYPSSTPAGRSSADGRRSEGSLLIDRFCFEIRHIAFRHGKPQDDLPADFVLGACQSDVAQLNYV